MNWEDEIPPEERTFRTFALGLQTYWDLIHPVKKYIPALTALMLVNQAGMIAVPLLMKVVFDEIVLMIGRREVSSLILLLLGLLLVVRITQSAIHAFVEMPIFYRAMWHLENWWPVMAHEKLLALSIGYHERENTGKKVSKVQKGCDKLVSIGMSLYFTLIYTGVSLLLTLIVLAWMDWSLALIFGGSFPIVIWRNYVLYRKNIPIWMQYEKTKEKSVGLFAQSIINVATVKYYAQEQREGEQFSHLRRSMEQLDVITSIRNHRTTFWIFSLLHVSFLSAVAVGVMRVVHGQTTMGTLVFLLATGGSITNNVKMLVDSYISVMRDLIAVRRMKELVDEPIEVQNAEHPITPQESHGSIVFSDVYFHYPQKDVDVISGVSLTVSPGTMIALVAKTGEGKTTLARLLTRMYDVTSGMITWRGIDIRQIDLSWYRRRFAVVQQDEGVFDLSIAGNVRYAVPDATDEEVCEVLRMAHLGVVLEDANRFPEGIQTMVGEQGIRLSGGERQRVGIARAYLAIQHGASILIFDEATSQLDAEAEQAIQEMLTRFRKERHVAVLAIAHRMATIERADEIYVIEEGKVSEHGNHAQLLARNGLYARFQHLQRLGAVRA